jgi:hypothetical protein
MRLHAEDCGLAQAKYNTAMEVIMYSLVVQTIKGWFKLGEWDNKLDLYAYYRLLPKSTLLGARVNKDGNFDHVIF